MKTLALSALALGLSASTQALARDFDPAAFAAANCTACHGSEVYTRADRRVDSLERLHAQVRMCDANLSTRLFDEDMDALVQYLNENFYRFPN